MVLLLGFWLHLPSNLSVSFLCLSLLWLPFCLIRHETFFLAPLLYPGQPGLADKILRWQQFWYPMWQCSLVSHSQNFLFSLSSSLSLFLHTAVTQPLSPIQLSSTLCSCLFPAPFFFSTTPCLKLFISWNNLLVFATLPFWSHHSSKSFFSSHQTHLPFSMSLRPHLAYMGNKFKWHTLTGHTLTDLMSTQLTVAAAFQMGSLWINVYF